MQKLKAPAIRGIQFHNQRERESETNPDIQKDRTDLNYDLINPGPIDYVEVVKNRIEEGVDSDKKIRKDAIRLCEFLITSDKDFFEDLSEDDEKKFFEKGYEFLKDRYGEENIIYAVVHKDERTPHLHVGFVPITKDSRLSAKDLFKKQDLVKLQDDFHKHMNEAGFKLERGVSSDRKHMETAKFKAQIKEEQIKELDQKIKKMEQFETQINNVDQIQSKKSLIGNNITLQLDNFNELKSLAQSGIANKQRAKQFEQRVEELLQEKKGLQKENRFLVKENDNLKSKVFNLEKVNKQLTIYLKNLLSEIDKIMNRIDKSGELKKTVRNAVVSFNDHFMKQEKERSMQSTREHSKDELER
jgi:Plasmid recombination enzyme